MIITLTDKKNDAVKQLASAFEPGHVNLKKVAKLEVGND